MDLLLQLLLGEPLGEPESLDGGEEKNHAHATSFAEPLREDGGLSGKSSEVLVVLSMKI